MTNFLVNFFFLGEPLNKYLLLLPFIFIYWVYKKQYSRILHLICFFYLAQIVVVFLKASLRIPHPKYSHTFAFPSGHMFVMLSLFLITSWLLLKNKKQAFVITNILGIFEAWRMIFLGFHTIYDVIGAYVIVFALFFTYRKIILPKIGLKKVLFFNVYAPYIIIVWFYKLCPVYITKQSKDLLISTIVSLATYIIIYIIEKRKILKVDSNID